MNESHVPQTDEELYLRDIFLDLWTNAVDSPDYDKKKWQEMRTLLERRNINV